MLFTPSLPKLGYRQVGGSGPRVLLIMGYGMRGEVWRPQIEGLSEECQVAYFDNRGVGASDAIGDSLTMLDMAKDAGRVLDAIEWQADVHLVGVSMGGMIAQELALHQPDRFTSLSLLATHAGGPTAALPPLKGVLRFLALRLGPAKMRGEALAKLLYPPRYLETCDNDELKRRLTLQMGEEPPVHTVRKQLSAIRKHDTRERLAALRLRTLIIKPELDILVRPKHSDELRRRITNSSMLSLSESGHGLIFQSAREINQRLLQHFNTEPAS